jgi:hypothetical protein
VLIGAFGGILHRAAVRAGAAAQRPEHLSRVIAGNNILNAMFMVLRRR